MRLFTPNPGQPSGPIKVVHIDAVMIPRKTFYLILTAVALNGAATFLGAVGMLVHLYATRGH